jgi:hypothetical protein
MNKIEKSFTTVKNTYGIYSIYSLIDLEGGEESKE